MNKELWCEDGWLFQWLLSSQPQSFFCLLSFLTNFSSSLRDFCSSSRNCFIHLFSCKTWRIRRTGSLMVFYCLEKLQLFHSSITVSYRYPLWRVSIFKLYNKIMKSCQWALYDINTKCCCTRVQWKEDDTCLRFYWKSKSVACIFQPTKSNLTVMTDQKEST